MPGIPKSQRLNENQQQSVVEEYLSGRSMERLAKKLNCSVTAIRGALLRHGVQLRTLRESIRLCAQYSVGRQSAFSEEETNEIVGRYLAGASTIELAEIYGGSAGNIWRVLKHQGVSLRSRSQACRTYILNEAVFDEPLTNEAKVWIGFLMADGCVHGDGLSVKAAIQDEEHLLAFRNFLGSSRPAYYFKHKTPAGCWNDYLAIVVHSRRLVTALRDHGVTPRKSYTATVSATLAFDPWFWSGVIDGDGTLQPPKRWIAESHLSLTGSSFLTTQFGDFVRSLSPNCYQRPKSLEKYGSRAWTMNAEGWHAVAVAQALYENNPYSLPRKKEVALEILRRAANCSHRSKPRPVPRPDTPELRAEMMRLYSTEGYSIETTALYLGISIPRLRSLLKSARVPLRDQSEAAFNRYAKGR